MFFFFSFAKEPWDSCIIYSGITDTWCYLLKCWSSRLSTDLRRHSVAHRIANARDSQNIFYFWYLLGYWPDLTLFTLWWIENQYFTLTSLWITIIKKKQNKFCLDTDIRQLKVVLCEIQPWPRLNHSLCMSILRRYLKITTQWWWSFVNHSNFFIPR